jgi:hypothetical protein
MASPRRFLVLASAALLLAPASRLLALAEDPAPLLTNRAPAKAAPRLASPRVTSLLSAATPKFTPEKPEKPTEMASAARVRVEDVPANGIVRLPPYIVRDRRPPKPEEVMVPRDIEKLAMQRYLGEEDGIDRGVLNLFTVKSLWKKIPVLGRYPLEGFATNEERAMEIYRAEKKKEEAEKYRGLMSPSLRPEAQPPAPTP